MSDGEQNHGDARQVANPHGVPVYSLAFGADADMKLLSDLATNGGTFNPVPDSGNTGMLAVFSQLMAGLLTDLDKIIKVAPGDFNQETDAQSGAVTVKFGDLFSGEVRKVVVDLLLVQATGSDYEADMLEVAVSYPDSKGVRQKFRGQTLHITRSGAATGVRATPNLVAENARRQHAQSIGAARVLADGDDLEQARDKLVEAQNALEDVLDQANPLVGILRTELQQLLDRMESPELYKAEGKAYALAAELSHARQRFASRGDVEGVRLFATPRLDAYLKQAKEFAENPDAPVPNADEDAERKRPRPTQSSWSQDPLPSTSVQRLRRCRPSRRSSQPQRPQATPSFIHPSPTRPIYPHFICLIHRYLLYMHASFCCFNLLSSHHGYHYNTTL
ncbi:hypothetical protein HU200_033107 [Digitaria exilis]|uniref:VWA-Hint protein Vwaint domain-containing protein n=1 Tax=Digitaria exilis TaxID=1010633 RepID=A0A835BLH6_9POAL|nr:hypothetical protein HU200_033107 [Digitaria exilis]